jgi:lipase maturation factor 1
VSREGSPPLSVSTDPGVFAPSPGLVADSDSNASSPPVADSDSIERGRVRDLFLRLLGLTFLVAFLSLLAQVRLLFGARGLLPAQEFLDAVRARAGFLDVPTLFWWTGAADAMLVATAILGILASILLVANIAPRAVLILLWFLYLSFASIGQDFLSFQWDNLLLESAFLSLFIAPAGWRPRRAPPPHRVGIFLMLWFVFRVHVESGAAKLLTGDPTWRDLTAMATYYETAPIPTWVGWYVHQMPMWAHKACSLFTFIVEIGLPVLIWVRSRAVRGAVFVLFIAMQISILLTANYGFFNYLTMALCLFVLDDEHLAGAGRVARRLRAALSRGSTLVASDRVASNAPAEPSVPPANGVATAAATTEAQAPPRRGRTSRVRDAAFIALALVIVPLSIVPFVRFFRAPELSRAVEPVWHVLSNWRSLNAYHLFASMTLVRREAIIEGSADGAAWSAYEFRYKPGDPLRAPPFVAPHQPRVDFQLWFLLLGGRASAPYFNTLLVRMLEEPRAVAPLFVRSLFPAAPPKMLRVSSYRYTFTSVAERRASGAWWNRTLERTTAPFGAEDVIKER